MVNELLLTNKNGLKLSTILSIPDNQDKPPMVILLQGFLGKKDGEKLNTLSSDLLKNGIASIRFDYAGYGKSDGNTQTEYLVSKIIEDIELILEFVKTNNELSTNKIGIWGQSMGGMLAVIIASLHSKIDAVCAVSCPSTITLNDDLENKITEWKVNGFLERSNSNGQLIRIGYEFVEDARKWSALDSVKKITAPKLFITGTMDTTVLPSITHQVFKASKKPKELIEVENMPHEYNQNSKFIEVINTASVNFYKKHLV